MHYSRPIPEAKPPTGAKAEYIGRDRMEEVYRSDNRLQRRISQRARLLEDRYEMQQEIEEMEKALERQHKDSLKRLRLRGASLKKKADKLISRLNEMVRKLNERDRPLREAIEGKCERRQKLDSEIRQINTRIFQRQAGLVEREFEKQIRSVKNRFDL